jgi:hypothetical protein
MGFVDTVPLCDTHLRLWFWPFILIPQNVPHFRPYFSLEWTSICVAHYDVSDSPMLLKVVNALLVSSKHKKNILCDLI